MYQYIIPNIHEISMNNPTSRLALVCAQTRSQPQLDATSIQVAFPLNGLWSLSTKSPSILQYHVCRRTSCCVQESFTHISLYSCYYNVAYPHNAT